MSATILIGTALTLVGTGITAGAQLQMVAEQTKASKIAENARQQQMQLEAQRKRRQAARESILARSQSLTIGTQQGAVGSSALASSLSGATAQGKQNIQGINSGEALGGRIFKANRDYFDATQAGQAGIAFGEGLSGFGSTVTKNPSFFNSLGG